MRSELKYLGKTYRDPIDEVETIKWKGDASAVIVMETKEFTSFCPVTGQPDFGQLKIEYCPKDKIIESKSLKLFLWRYRYIHQFYEYIIDDIATRLWNQVSPKWLRITGSFSARGGIYQTVTIEKKG